MIKSTLNKNNELELRFPGFYKYKANGAIFLFTSREHGTVVKKGNGQLSIGYTDATNFKYDDHLDCWERLPDNYFEDNKSETKQPNKFPALYKYNKCSQYQSLVVLLTQPGIGFVVQSKGMDYTDDDIGQYSSIWDTYIGSWTMIPNNYSVTLKNE